MSWVRAGERKYVPYENPQRQRYNTLVLYAPDGVQPAFDWIDSPRAFTGADLVRLLLEWPPCPVPLVIVLDNGSLHHSPVVRDARPSSGPSGSTSISCPHTAPVSVQPHLRASPGESLPREQGRGTTAA
jgi:hypothetical protein